MQTLTYNSMTEPGTEPEDTGLKLEDLLFVLLRQKKKILLCAAIGILAAVGFWTRPAVYESNAKLMVRYVIDKSAIDQVDPQVKMSNGEAVINSEVEILTSRDLAVQVVQELGIPRLAPGGTEADAVRNIRSGLSVSALKESNIMLISYKNGDPELARRLLEELVNRYFDKHLQVHRSTGAFEFVAQQAEQVRTELHDTEEALKRLKAKAGVASITESGAAFNLALTKGEETLKATEVELAEQRARVRHLEASLGGSGQSYASAGMPASNDRDALQKYQTLAMQMARVREREVDLLSKFTPESRFVQVNRSQISSLQSERREMEGKSAGLFAAMPAVDFSRVPQLDLIAEKVRLAALEAGTVVISTQVRSIQEQIDRLAEFGTQIAELERKKELEETNYKYFQASLEKARIDEALDPSKIPNISIVQKPSVALKDSSHMAKILLCLVGGGAAFGLALAFSIELGLDRSIKRPLELETRLGIPLWISIPYMAREDDLFTRLHNGLNGRIAAVRCEIGSLMRPYCEAIRDRLSLGFENDKRQHKPKLVAVTSLHEGAGTSTIARGVALALSEAGEGKVLLVATHIGLAEINEFFEGRPKCSLSEALQMAGPLAPNTDNLYLAAVAPLNAREGRIIPKKFYALMPDLRASDYEYIVFDLAPLNQTSATLAMAGFMDKLLLVVEAENDNRDVVKRAHAELVAAKADVSAVFNKARFYGTKWIKADCCAGL